MKRPLALTLISVVLIAGAAGCTVATVPGAERVVITKNAKDVEDCKIIGKGRLIISIDKTGENDLKNSVVAAGGDTFLILSTTPLVASNGMIYNCKGGDVRQPVPVTSPTTNGTPGPPPK